MALTKAQARTAIREAIDDPNAKFWSDAALDVLTSATLDDLWSELLEINPWLLSQLQTFTGAQLTSPGYIDLRPTGSGGALTKRFYRVQRLIRDGREYESTQELQIKYRIVVEANTETTAPRFVYHVQGDQAWIHPLALDTSVEFRYAYLPDAYTSLADSGSVVWPEGHDSAYIFETAARAFVKGDGEDMRQYKQLSTEAFDKTKSHLARRQVGAMRMQMVDDSAWWGT